MPTLTVEDLSLRAYDVIARRAAAARRSVSEEAKLILEKSLGAPMADADKDRLPDLIPSEEILPPCDLPLSGTPKRVRCRAVEPPVPDPLVVDEHGT